MVGRAWFYERHGIPMPAEGEELLMDEPEETPDPVDPAQPPGDKPPGAKPPVKNPPAKKPAVSAADAAVPLTVDLLSESVLEGLTGVSREWLSPVRPFFDRLAALAMSRHVTDEDFLSALEKARRELPEIFDLMDTQALEEAFSQAISSAALAGSVSRP